MYSTDMTFLPQTMEKNPDEFSDAAVDHQGAPPTTQEPELTTDMEFRYFEELQRRPMTREDMIKFLILVGVPTFFFIVAVSLMHVYND
ncbi:hypothetical protein ACOMHN_063815 [Nucella lapillus]